ncbi:MAG: HEAT repeat domain-containing protein [Myxococcales bacterium]|nr:HEAT repeat domain-containing protein [Myxococcales bacterium]
MLFAGAWAGLRAQTRQDRIREVLTRMPAEADLLINLDPDDLPSTSEMIRLGRGATPAIVNGLVNNMSAYVRAACAAVLTATRDPAALQALIDALEDPDDDVRSLAIRALGQVESREATPHLLALVGAARVPAYLQGRAIESLGRLGDPAAVGPLFAYFKRTWDGDAQQALWDLRRRLSPAQLREWVLAPLNAKGDDQPPRGVLRGAVEAAGGLAVREAVPALMRRFDDDETLQNAIVHSLGLIGDKRAVPFLRGLRQRSAEARLLNNVVFALQRLGEDVVPFLREALADRRAYIRFNAAFVAGDLGQKALVPALLTALADRNDYVRSETAVALGRIGDAAAVAALTTASREENPIVRRDALLALAAIDYPTHRQRVLDELVPSQLDSVRARAVRFLADRGDPEVVAVVLGALDPTDWQDRDVAIAYLNRFWTLESPDVTAFLLRLAAESSHRPAALRLLARLRDERARFALRQWLRQPDGAQDELLRAMGRFRDGDATPLVRFWLSGEDASARLHAAFALACLGEKEGLDVLLAALETAPVNLKRTAARLLTEVDPKLHPGLKAALTALLDHADVYVRISAARPLIEAGDAAAYARLWTELGKRVPFIRDEVLDIVERAPKTSREQIFGEWLAAADPMLRRELQAIRARNP